MPTLVTRQGTVHYEVYGRGQPVIFLHGWLGSWALWRDTIENIGTEFRAYALDFFGFGESKDRMTDYSVENFIKLVSEFMDRLGIVSAPLVGHSMGGTVALGVASRHPEKVSKVVVIGSPVDGSSLNPFLKLAGYRGIADLTFAMPVVLNSFIYILTHMGTKDGKTVHRMVKEDASKVSVDAFFQSIGTLRKTDLRSQIRDVSVPVLGAYGRRDIIVDPGQSKVLHASIPHSQEAWFENAGHFIMIDEPAAFQQTITQFLRTT